MIALLQPKRSGLPARMAEFVSIRGLQRDKGRRAPPQDEADGRAATTWWTRFEETLEIADIKIEPETIVAGTIVATVLDLPPHLCRQRARSWWALLALVVPYLVA